VEPEAQEHADRVLEKNAKKVCRDAFSNARLQVVNAYMNFLLLYEISGIV
jgi:hypothetical protein